MEWFFLLVAYLPVVSAVVGLGLLIAGFLLRKRKKQGSKGLFIAGGICVGIWLLLYIALFLAGALGIGPAPG